MGDKKKDIVYSNFAGGQCSIDDGENCLPNQLQLARNLVVDDKGLIRKRPGFVRLYENTHSDFIIDIGAPYLSLHDKTINWGAGTAYTYTNGGLGQFSYMDGHIHTNGIDPMIKISGVTANVVLGAPLSRILFKHNDRAFVSNGAVLYETVVDTYPDNSVDNFAGGASWTIGDTGQSIIGLGSIGRNLFVFKQKEIFVQYGYTKSERQTYKLTGEYGCISPDTIKNAKLYGIGECIIFLSQNYELCAVTNDGVIVLGECVQDILDTIYKGAAVNEASLSSELHRARAAVHPDGYYILGFATTADDTHNAFDQALCLNLNISYDSQFGTRYPITLWNKTDIADTSLQTFGAFGYLDINVVYGFDILVPTTTVGGDYVFSKIDFSYYYDRQTASAPHSDYFIDWKLKTRNEDAGLKRVNKNWTDMLLVIQQKIPSTGSAFFPVLVTQEVDYNLTIDSPPEVYQENFVLLNKPAKYLLEGSHNLVGDGVQMNITLENYKALVNPDIRIYGITILFLRSNLV